MVLPTFCTMDPDQLNELGGHLTIYGITCVLGYPVLHASQAHASDTRWALSSPRFRPQPFEGSQALRFPSPSLHSLSDGTQPFNPSGVQSIKYWARSTASAGPKRRPKATGVSIWKNLIALVQLFQLLGR